MNKNDKLALRDIADHYGVERQNIKCIEEMAELTQVLSKIYNNPFCEETYICIVQEIADVSVMLKQLIYLYRCKDKVNEIMHQKIARQLERMKNEP